jgi:serine protease AprX
MKNQHRRRLRGCLLSLLLVVGSLGRAEIKAPASADPILQVIVQGPSSAASQAAIARFGGTVRAALPIIDGFAADVPASAIPSLSAAGLMVMPDRAVAVADTTTEPITEPIDRLLYPSLATGAAALQQDGLTGAGVTVAVIDSGMPPLDAPEQWTQVTTNTLAYGIGNAAVADPPATGPPPAPWFLVYKDMVTTTPIQNSADPYGHGTHVLATIADGRSAMNPTYGRATVGIAPGANLVVLRALDDGGVAPYSRMIAAIDWVVAHKDSLNIRVLNLSIQADVHGPYWFDPLGQAVMAAWDAGITVVVAGGNTGPNPATITVPGNVPYVITVGALKPGIYTENGVDTLAQYSSAGPTESKFIKPDVIVAGSRVIAPLPATSMLAPIAGLQRERAKLMLPRFRSAVDLNYYALSGTSMAAAETSGLVALLLQHAPGLSNNQVKYRLTATAEVATDGQGNAAASVWQQGAGKLMPTAMISSTTTAAANAGMDLALDRDHENGTHYMGQTDYISDTTTFVYPDPSVTLAGYSTWAGGYSTWAGGYSTWAGGYSTWAGSYAASWANADTRVLCETCHRIFVPLFQR